MYEKQNQMAFGKDAIIKIWTLFSGKEKRNIFIYIVGIMLYKFVVEAFNGSVVSLAANCYDQEAANSGTGVHTFERIGLLSGLNQAFQCIGSILIAPLTKRWPTRAVLSVSIFIFAIFSVILLIVDVATGGYIKPSNISTVNETNFNYYGKYNTKRYCRR